MDFSQAHLLLVEDSETQALKLMIQLEEVGWQVSHVVTGEAGLDFLNETIPDLILIDYFLPGMQGDAFCRQVRMKQATRKVPLIILTESESNAPQTWVRDSGASDYMSKSEPFDSICRRIEKQLQIARFRNQN